LPIVAIAGQVLVLDDTVGPWLTFGYAPLGILALLVSTKTLVTPLQRALICGANFDCAAGSLVNALDHFLYSYFFIWPATLVLVMLPAAAAAQVNTRRALRLFCQGIGFRG